MDSQFFIEEPVAVGDSARQIEKQARQLAYDTRYFVKKQLAGKPVNAATMERLLMMRLQKSTAVPAVKARAKEMLVGKIKKQVVAKESHEIKDIAIDNVANTLYKVFIEGAHRPSDIHLNYIEELFNDDTQKFKVRVTDVDKGTSYIRFANHKKITELRLKGLKVEKTEHGDPREDEARQGSQTAAALGGGQAKKDYDGDGKIESGAKEHAGAVHNAIQRKRGGVPDGQDTSSVREDYIRELNSSEITGRKITGTGVNNSSIIKIFPEDKSDLSSGGANVQQGTGQKQPIAAGYELSGSLISEKRGDALTRFSQFVAEKAESEQQQKLFGLALSVKRGETPRSEVSDAVLKIVDTMSEKKIRDFAKTKHEGLPKKVEEEKESACEKDPRELPTERELIKNKLRAALGVKNPIVMTAGYEPDGDQLDEFLGGQPGDGYIGHPRLGIKSLTNPPSKTSAKAAPKNTGLAGRLGNRASEMEKLMQMNSYEVEGEVVSEEESDRENDRAREAGDWRSRSERPVRRRGPSVADDPRYGSMSDAEWARSSHNPANKRRRYR